MLLLLLLVIVVVAVAVVVVVLIVIVVVVVVAVVVSHEVRVLLFLQYGHFLSGKGERQVMHLIAYSFP